MTGKSLTLRVTLTGTDPEVWRLVRVSAEMTLAELSDALEDVMGWYGDHLHEFRARGVTYWTPPQYGDDIDGYEDDAQYRLGDLLWRRRMKLRWVYDLGDCWHHEMVVESIDPITDSSELPSCIGGGGARPPEGCGGLWGYYELVEALGDESHPCYNRAVEWLGEDFDPNCFDLAASPKWRLVNRQIFGALEAGEPFRATQLG